MGALDKFIEGAEEGGFAMNDATHAAINRIIKRHEAEILSWNTQNQLYDQGIGGDGERLIPEYAESTKKRKSKLGQPIDRVTLRDTKTFHDKFTIHYGYDYIQIEAPPLIKNRSFSLTSWLKERYGKDIFGLTEANLEKLREIVKKELPFELKQNA